jgi:hypothetical protein
VVLLNLVSSLYDDCIKLSERRGVDDLHVSPTILPFRILRYHERFSLSYASYSASGLADLDEVQAKMKGLMTETLKEKSELGEALTMLLVLIMLRIKFGSGFQIGGSTIIPQLN